MKNITIIVPVHEYNEKLLERSLKSTPDYDYESYTILFVGPKDVCKKAEKLSKKIRPNNEIMVIENDETDFVTQINKGVYGCVTPYFTILEFDDEMTENYGKVIQKYVSEQPELSVILPINEYVKAEDYSMISFGNEIALDASFTENIGEITMSELENYMDYNCTGGLFKTEDFISIGCLKKSLKIAAWYEFLMRCIYKSKKIYVIPKILYRHTIARDGSYMKLAQEEISGEEGRFLIKLAKEEYFFKEDRNKSYLDQEQETDSDSEDNNDTEDK